MGWGVSSQRDRYGQDRLCRYSFLQQKRTYQSSPHPGDFALVTEKCVWCSEISYNLGRDISLMFSWVDQCVQLNEQNTPKIDITKWNCKLHKKLM